MDGTANTFITRQEGEEPPLTPKPPCVLCPSALNLIRFCLGLQLTLRYLSDSLYVPYMFRHSSRKIGVDKMNIKPALMGSNSALSLGQIIFYLSLSSVWFRVLIWKMEIKIVSSSGWKDGRMNEWMKNWYIHLVGYGSSLKRKKILSYATKWMNFELCQVKQDI